MSTTVEITAKTDLKAFRAEKKREVAEILSRSGKFCRDAIGVYFRWLAQFSPPSIGKQEIDAKYYERPAILLPLAIARGSKDIAADRAALAQGFSWKVKQKGKTPKYFKGKGETLPAAAKKARHIVNRGLLRWSFVGVLPNVGVAVPVVMRPLAAAKRGKNLKKNENQVASATFSMGPNEALFRIRQNVASSGTGSWYANAVRVAEEQHDIYLKRKLEKFGKVSNR